MKTSFRKYILAAVLSTTAGTMMAQDLNSAYFTQDFKYRHDMNAAYGNDQGYVAIPILGNLNVKMQGSLGVGDVLFKNPYYGNPQYPNAKKTSSFYKAFESVFGTGSWKKYVSGGLATQTGPAWLDGTPSKPELVLNATDTTNFIALKDILSEIMRGSHERAADQSSTNGNNYYDIRVEVDSIDSDYGVDQAADRIKELIEEDAMYRNVTAVNKTR
jgi:hypothetical protein